MNIIILLAFSSFCMGVAEFIVSGILPSLSEYYTTSISNTGYLSTIYAFGVVLGAPIISMLISSWNYRKQLFSTLFLFSCSNFIIFLSESFFITLFARFISGLMHGLFFVIATIVALRVAPAQKTSFAISLMVSGLTIALVTGIPLGIFLSEQYSLLFPFLFIACVSLCVAIAILFIMPTLDSTQTKLRDLCIAFRFPPLYQGFMITALTCGSQFVLYIYLRVFLEYHAFTATEIQNIFLYYGLSAIIGNLYGGKLTDAQGVFRALSYILIAQVLCFSAMSVSYLFSPLAVTLNIIAMSFFGFASIAPLKMLCTSLADKYTPSTQNNTIALNEGAFNVGIMLASLIGGLVEEYIHINYNGIFSALFSLLACSILIVYIKDIILPRKQHH